MKVIITGVTGMVGEGVLHEALKHPHIDEVLAFSRRPSGIIHTKLKEIIHQDFFDISPVKDMLNGYDACFFCLGVSSLGMKEAEYFRLSHTLTLHVAETLLTINPHITFCYISGAGTDSTTKGRIMWARVKGRTENDLMKLSFKNVYNFRPAMIEPTKGLKHTLKAYKYMGWLLPIIKFMAPKSVCSLKELGLAMINSVIRGYRRHVLEVSDIKELAAK